MVKAMNNDDRPVKVTIEDRKADPLEELTALWLKIKAGTASPEELLRAAMLGAGVYSPVKDKRPPAKQDKV